MRSPRLTLLTGTALLAAATLAADAGAQVKTGQDLPGSFQPLSVIHPDKKREGKFHSPVCEHALSPGVLVFVADVGEADRLTPLLKKLDELVGKNGNADLRACVVFLKDGGYREALGSEPLKNLDAAMKARAEEEMKVKDLARAAGLKNLALSIDSPAGPKDYRLGDEASATVLVYAKQRVSAVFTFNKESPPADKDVDAVAAAVEKVLPAKKVPAKPPARKPAT